MGWKQYWDRKSRLETTVKNRFLSYDPEQIEVEADDHIIASLFLSSHATMLDISTKLKFDDENIAVETVMGRRGRKFVCWWACLIIVFFLSVPFSSEIEGNGFGIDRLHVYLGYIVFGSLMWFALNLMRTISIIRINSKVRQFLWNKMFSQKPIPPDPGDLT